MQVVKPVRESEVGRPVKDMLARITAKSKLSEGHQAMLASTCTIFRSLMLLIFMPKGQEERI